MVGEYKVVIETPVEVIEINVKRKYTFIDGRTADNKSYLIYLLEEYERKGEDSLVKVESRCNVEFALSYKMLERIVKDRNAQSSIVFVDEAPFIKSDDFSRLTEKASQYFVICTRVPISCLPYSIDEIYTLDKFGKRGKKSHICMRPYYDNKTRLDFKPDYIVTEDTNSGFEFFKFIAKDADVISAGGKSKIYELVIGMLMNGCDKILVVADSAAFGSCVDSARRLLRLAKRLELKLCIFLPESFEYLILKSNILKLSGIEDEIENTHMYAETSEHFSWERYFSARLEKATENTRKRYKKKKLYDYYKTNYAVKNIVKTMKSEL